MPDPILEIPRDRIKCAVNPEFDLRLEQYLEKLKKGAAYGPFPVYRDLGIDNWLVLDREIEFGAVTAMFKTVRCYEVSDLRSHMRSLISKEIQDRENAMDLALRMQVHSERFRIKSQSKLGGEFGCSQALVSQYLSLPKYIYPEVKGVYQDALITTTEDRTDKNRPRTKRGAEKIGLKHLYHLTRLHHERSGLPEDVAKSIQCTLMEQITTDCLPEKKLKDEVKRRHDEANKGEFKATASIPTTCRVYGFDSRYLRFVLQPESVHLVLTSPPFGLKMTYDRDQTLADHLENIIPPLQAVERPLVPGGLLIVELIDHPISGSPCFPFRDIVIYGISETGLKFDTVLGWDKTTSSRRNLRNERKPHTSYQFHKNMSQFLVFRKPGERAVSTQDSDSAKRQILDGSLKNEWSHGFNQVLRFHTGRKANDPDQSDAAAAKFPEVVPDWFIRAFTLPGDRVLDPFCGTGTVLRVADRLGRSSIGFENNPRQLENLGDLVSAKQCPTARSILPGGWREVLKAVQANIWDRARS